MSGLPTDPGAASAEAPQDPEATRELFRRFVAEYENRIYNTVLRLVDDPHEAQDLTQDTFVAAYRAWHTFRQEAAVYTWLYRIAVNLTKNRRKQLRRRRQIETASLDDRLHLADGEDDIEREVMDQSHTPDRLLESRELGAFLGRQVARLPDDFREVVVLRDYQGLSYKEIADIVGCSVKAIKSRLFRARTILRDKLRLYLDEGLE